MGAPSDRRKQGLLTRRQALGVLGTLGAAGAAAAVGTTSEATATGAATADVTASAADGGVTRPLASSRRFGSETTITTIAYRDRSLQTAVVPADWYERERHARSVLASVRSRFADESGVVDVTLGTGGERVAGRPTSSVDVYVERGTGDAESGTDLTARVSGTVDGVASRLVEVPPLEPLPGGGPDSTDRSAAEESNQAVVGGGATLLTRRGTTASATCGVTWRGDPYLLTCAHLFADREGRCDRVDGQDVYDPTGRRLGQVVRSDRAQDWALVDDSGDVRFDASIAEVPGEVRGRVTTAGLHYLKSEGVEVRKTGQATPERRGPIQAVGVRHGGCELGDGHAGQRYLDVDVPAVPGDSGGPVYHEFEYRGRSFLALVGMVAARVGGTRASSADAIHREHDVAFGPRSPFPV